MFLDSGKIKAKVPARFSDDYPDDGPIEEEGDYSTLASTNFDYIKLLILFIKLTCVQIFIHYYFPLSIKNILKKKYFSLNNLILSIYIILYNYTYLYIIISLRLKLGMLIIGYAITIVTKVCC